MRLLCIFAVLLPAFAIACINDRDTLAFEKRNVNALEAIERQPDPNLRRKAVEELVLRAIGGRFERYPAKYYEMRIARLLKKATLTPPEYDDLAVAYDRIGKIDEAIKAILKSKNLRQTEAHKYSFHANYGTFLVHRWIAAGHKDSDVKTLKESIQEIKMALKINPNSHFGRENVQLALEESWLPENREKQFYESVGRIDEEKLAIGTAGIIMMGLGYELPDTYLILNEIILSETGTTSEFAGVRFTDLVSAGHTSILPIKIPAATERQIRRTMTKEAADRLIAKQNADLQKARVQASRSDEYSALIEDGERVHTDRTSYMIARLNLGKHPDTHADFWNEWHEPEYPVLRPDPNSARSKSSTTVLLPIFAVLASIVVGGFFLVRRILRSKPV
ncbi:MAG: hypothetical protein ABL949_04335 [Fimbriimonadaceae bacterium]